jgi:type VII secretion-associated serine protease mycosin
MQWYLRALHVAEAHRITRGDGIVVAVIDSGVDASHPDLAGAVLPGVTFNHSTSEEGQNDWQGHGTKMAGVIAARGGGPNKALGIAPGSRILPIAIPDTSGSVAEPLRFAVDRGAQVVNISLGRPREERLSAAEVSAFAYAQAKNVVVVTSSGNLKSLPTGNCMAEVPGVVTVSGTSRDGSFWNGSVQGSFVGLSAPAVDIVNVGARKFHSTGYSGGTGTSESSAIVAGIAALIRARYPALDASNVINRLVMSAHDQGSPGRDPLYGFGTVDAHRALTADVPSVNSNPLGAVTRPGSPTSQTPASPTGQEPAEEQFGTPAVRLAIVVGIGVTIVLVGAGLLLVLILVIAHAAKPRRAQSNLR